MFYVSDYVPWKRSEKEIKQKEIKEALVDDYKQG